MSLTKLDHYDYILLPGVIRIKLDATNDPSLVDIMSELDRAGNRVYVEGNYYTYLDEYYIHEDPVERQVYLDLKVVQTI